MNRLATLKLLIFCAMTFAASAFAEGPRYDKFGNATGSSRAGASYDKYGNAAGVSSRTASGYDKYGNTAGAYNGGRSVSYDKYGNGTSGRGGIAGFAKACWDKFGNALGYVRSSVGGYYRDKFGGTGAGAAHADKFGNTSRGLKSDSHYDKFGNPKR